MSGPALTFVTTCKGRLRHLQATLPHMVAQPGARCIVVDYDCPDRAGDWVESHHPGVEVVRWRDAPHFNPAHARNLGAARARTEALCMIDADVAPAPGFAAAVLALFDPRRYLLPEPFSGDVSGTVVCARAAFEFADGYDEACTGWGGEDIDLYDRFALHGLARGAFPATLLATQSHSDDERVAHHAQKDKFLSNSTNLMYSHIKLDLMRLSGAKLPLPARRALHEQVRAAAEESFRRGAAVGFEVPFADATVNFCSISSALAYRIDATAGRSATAAGLQ